MSDIACLCTQVNTMASLSSQFTNLKNWDTIAPYPLSIALDRLCLETLNRTMNCTLNLPTIKNFVDVSITELRLTVSSKSCSQ